MMRYGKLVRDRIPEIIKSKNKEPVTRVMNKDEYFLRLKEKLIEEVDEFLTNQEVEELADILEVVYALGEEKGFSGEEIDRKRSIKAKERGGFKERIFLEEVKE